MRRYAFVIYKPPAPGLPWLAVTMDGNKAMDTFGCPSEAAAEQVLSSMKERWSAKAAYTSRDSI